MPNSTTLRLLVKSVLFATWMVWSSMGCSAITFTNQRLSIDAPPISGCKLPDPITTLLTRDPAPYLYFEAEVNPQDVLTSDWVAPDGTVIKGVSWTPATGKFCFNSTVLSIRPGRSGSMPGHWTSRVFNQGRPLLTVPFTIISPPLATNRAISTTTNVDCTVPPSVASVTLSTKAVSLYFESTVTTDDLLANDWEAPDGTIIDGGAWDPGDGQYCFTGVSLPIPTNITPKRLGVWKAQVFDNGRLLFFISFKITDPASSTSITIKSLSSTSSTPLVPITIQTSGVDKNSDLKVTFKGSSGFSVSEHPIRVAPDGSVIAAVPIYLDPQTGKISNGLVSVGISSNGRISNSLSLAIEELPRLDSYGVKLGQISHSFLIFEALVLGEQINNLQVIQSLPRNAVNTTGAHKTQETLLQSVIRARRDIDRVMIDNAFVVDGGVTRTGPLASGYKSNRFICL